MQHILASLKLSNDNNNDNNKAAFKECNVFTFPSFVFVPRMNCVMCSYARHRGSRGTS